MGNNMKIIDEKLKTIHLQGIGRVDAKPATEIKIGDILIWNYGYKSTVKSVEKLGE